MTRGKQEKLYRTFTKGLITEAGFLTYPEDASVDELNTIIYRKGNRTRRPGIDFEEGSAPLFYAGYDEDDITTEYFWRSPGSKGNLNFLVIQLANKLLFFNATISPLSSASTGLSVDLLDFKSPTATDDQVKTTRVHMVGGKGHLFVAQEFIDPIIIQYLPDAGSLIPTRIIIQIRDFDGIDDGLTNDAEPASLTDQHKYNLRNQGWVTPGTAVTPLPDGSTPGTSGSIYNPWTGDKYNGPDGDPIPL